MCMPAARQAWQGAEWRAWGESMAAAAGWPTPSAASPPLVAGGAEGRSGIAALLKIVTAGPSKGGKQQGGSGKGQAQAGAAEADDADSEEEAEGGAERQERGAGRRGGSATAGGRARQRLRPLMRPIICICNDLYAPALRPLRDVARVFHFKKPQVGLVSARCGKPRILILPLDHSFC